MLEIFRASAGSGKTYRLTQRYLEMLLTSGRADKYKSVMAVTFTNKATAEMKRRIIEELYRLSSEPENSSLIGVLTKNKGIMKIASAKGLDIKDYISSAAGKYLIAILNDYSLFGVSTIDRFLQQIMRAFSRELGQYPSYNVELDDKSVLQFAIDNLMNSLDENIPVLDWLIKLSLESIRKGGDWNAVSKLYNLGNELFTERYKLAMSDIGEDNISREAVEAYKSKLTEYMAQYRNEILELRERALEILGRYGLKADMFKGGASKSFMKYVTEKINDASKEIPHYSETFLKKAQGDVEDWFAQKCKVKETIIAAYNDGLGNILRAIADEENRRHYDTCRAILSNITEMGVLGDILNEIRKYCKEKNILLLSDTTAFLSKIIDSSNTPFIYEKVGIRIENYLLDEFQDTSRLQWNNFKVLIEESLASGNNSLVVGDVKQSIYRWRGSDWNLLYKEISEQFARWRPVSCSLDYNWRSSFNVVSFNNDFFSKVPDKILDKQDCGIYADTLQKIPENVVRKDGHVTIRFFECETKMSDDGIVGENILNTLKILTGNGYRLGEIVFLVRTNEQGEILAKLLLSNGYNVMTEESLKIGSSAAVRRIVNTLRLIDTPDNKIVRYMSSLMDRRAEKESPIVPDDASLYNLCEDAIRKLSDDEKGEIPFIQAFLDAVSDFISSEGSDLHRFLKWWDEIGSGRSVSAPAGDNSVKVMTIHKSKGLEFKAVIIPFLEESFVSDKNAGMVWCKTGNPKDEIQVVPLPCTKSALEGTDFSDIYRREARSRVVDSLNLSYVAFTRAIDELIIFAKIKADSKGNYLLNSIGNALYNHLSPFLNENNFYELGSWTKCSENSDNTEEVSESGQFVSVPIGKRLQLSLRGGEFFENEESGGIIIGTDRTENPESTAKARRRGIVLHDILSKVEIESDLKKAVGDSVREGILSIEESGKVFDLLSEMLVSAREKHWFDGSYKLLNEVTILTPQGMEYRPDRVMIRGNEAVVVDYKFGKIHSAEYNAQVRSYMSILSEMGYRNVRGFLWYSDRILELYFFVFKKLLN